MSNEINNKNFKLPEITQKKYPELNGSLVELESVAVGMLTDISALIKMDSKKQDDLSGLIDILDDVQIILMSANRLRRICR